MARGTNGVPYSAVHALAILGTTIAVYGALGVAFSPVIGPVPGVTLSRVIGGLLFAFGALLTVWAITYR